MKIFRAYTGPSDDGGAIFRRYKVATAAEARRLCVEDTGKEPLLVTDDLNVYPGLK